MIRQNENIQSQKEKVGLHQHSAKRPKRTKSINCHHGSSLKRDSTNEVGLDVVLLTQASPFSLE